MFYNVIASIQLDLSFFLGSISLSKKEEKMNNTFIFTDISAGLITGHFRDPQILTFKT